MSYRICYERPLAVRNPAGIPHWQSRVEEFPTEHEALGRARQLIEAGDRHAVSLEDASGNVLCGLRLHLRLGYTTE